MFSDFQAQGQISLLSRATLTFGLTHYPYSEFELLAEELLMSDSTIKVFICCYFMQMLYSFCSILTHYVVYLHLTILKSHSGVWCFTNVCKDASYVELQNVN